MHEDVLLIAQHFLFCDKENTCNAFIKKRKVF